MSDAEFLSHIGHTEEEMAVAKIDLADLRNIYDEHEKRQNDLVGAGELVQRALARVEGVHSTRVRVKSPRSLARKIVRKQTDKPERNICFSNYKEEVRDLIGLRALHLFKEDWRPIHRAILERWNLHPDEQPLAYLREGDNKKLKQAWEDAGLNVIEREGGYRSLHFIVQTPFDKTPCYAEIQVRTLFEEAWGEVDHQVRYPDHQGNELLGEYLLILNRLAGGADEMASLLLQIKELQIAYEKSLADRAEKDVKIESLNQESAKFIEQLNISKGEKDQLKKQLAETERTLRRLDDEPHINSLAAILANMNTSAAIGGNTILAAMAAQQSKKRQENSDGE